MHWRQCRRIFLPISRRVDDLKLSPLRSARETMRKKASRPRHARMLGAATRGTKQQPTGLIAYPAAQGRAVRFPYGLHETATTLDIPSRWDPNTKKERTGLFFAACGRPCSFDSSYGLHETATTLDIPTGWDPRANQSPTGALVAVLRTAALFDSRMGQIKNALAQCAKAFL